LRQEGEDFARANPKLASHLGQMGDDPDVERLLEGFAYLTGRVQESMAYERLEFNHALISVLWPSFLRPIPSATLMQLDPKPERITSRQIVPAGTTILSRAIEGVHCPFRTVHECAIHPLELISCEADETGRSQLSLHFRTLNDLPLKDINLQDLRLTCLGEAPVRQILYLWLGRYLERCEIILNEDKKSRLDFKKHMTPIGLSNQESLLPHPRTAFEGARLLQEFFTFPDKFYGYDLTSLAKIFRDKDERHFTLKFSFERPLPKGIRIMPDALALHCVSAVNLFPHDGDPLLIHHEKRAYPVRPSGDRARYLEIFSVDAVRAASPSPDKRRVKRSRLYPSFESFLHESHKTADGQRQDMSDEAQIYYRLRPRPSRKMSGFDYEISFVRYDDPKTAPGKPGEEAISLELSCFNRNLCHELAVGDVIYAGAGAPDFVSYRNVVRPSRAIHPPLDGTLSWNLLTSLALNYRTLLSRDAIAALLTIYDYESAATPQQEQLSAQRISAIRSFETKPVTRIHKGLAMRGQKSHMRLRESAFHTEGEMYLFATILAEFFNLCSTVNSFHDLEVLGEENGEIYQWPAKIKL